MASGLGNVLLYFSITAKSLHGRIRQRNMPFWSRVPRSPTTEAVYQEMGLMSSHLHFKVIAQPPPRIHSFLLHCPPSSCPNTSILEARASVFTIGFRQKSCAGPVSYLPAQHPYPSLMAKEA